MANVIIMVVCYCVVIALSFFYRFSYLRGHGVCYIGIDFPAVNVLLAFDVVAHVSPRIMTQT
jgi:hypothetical protein